MWCGSPRSLSQGSPQSEGQDTAQHGSSFMSPVQGNSGSPTRVVTGQKPHDAMPLTSGGIRTYPEGSPGNSTGQCIMAPTSRAGGAHTGSSKGRWHCQQRLPIKGPTLWSQPTGPKEAPTNTTCQWAGGEPGPDRPLNPKRPSPAERCSSVPGVARGNICGLLLHNRISGMPARRVDELVDELQCPSWAQMPSFQSGFLCK